jgi:hypothetical protein
MRGLAGLLALALLPGLAVVKSPWPYVPFLSLSFWLVSAWWLPGRVARSDFVGAALLSFAALTALRLLKPVPPLQPSPRTLAVYALALACLAPVAYLPVAPGLDLASTEATLIAWRDGLPSTYEPLAPIPAFSAHAPGLPLLAADLSHLTGVAPYRAVLWLAQAGLGLLVIALAALCERVHRGAWAVPLGVSVTVAAVFLSTHLPLGPILAGALGLAAVGALVKGSGRSPAVAAGVFLAAGITVDVVAGLAGWAAVAVFGDRTRRALALVLGLVLALPRLVELRAFSVAELRHAAARSAPLPHPDAVAAMHWLNREAGPLDAVCVFPRDQGAYVPAVAARAVVPSSVPAVYAEEAGGRPGRACRYLLVVGPPGPEGALAVPAGAPFVPGGRLVFSRGWARVFEAPRPGT